MKSKKATPAKKEAMSKMADKAKEKKEMMKEKMAKKKSSYK